MKPLSLDSPSLTMGRFWQAHLWNVSKLKLILELWDKDSNWAQTTVVKWFKASHASWFLFIGTARGQMVLYKYNNANGRIVTSENIFKNTSIDDLDFDSANQRLIVCDNCGEIRAYNVNTNFKLKLSWKYKSLGSFTIRQLHFDSDSEGVVAYTLHTGQR
ncbi:hypothetical protein FA15DRAFT_711034 [Coprinopsis marcescibilis]|uniref:WD40 repeat-like protein n=1 Tax=Coprinopsis marcescibilis TaxID=230819 RepID=A0A5C3KBB6_COPMA|nr:hypothetical protein FA15DRAFT_711034 [Coprinopsis marcescibilis]